MHLPGRLAASTLGDLLGALHRAFTTGQLELTEVKGSMPGYVVGRKHRIHLFSGLVAGVETGLPARPLGEILHERGYIGADKLVALMRYLAWRDGRLAGQILIEEGLASRRVVDAGLRAQAQGRLEPLFSMVDATIAFHTAKPLSDAARRIGLVGAQDFLVGRPRARDRSDDPYAWAPPAPSVRPQGQPERRVSPNRPWSNVSASTNVSANANAGPYKSASVDANANRSARADVNAYVNAYVSASASARRPDVRSSASSRPPESGQTRREEAPPPSTIKVIDPSRARALRTLGLAADADEGAIRKAFRRLAVELHPDRHAMSPDDKRATTSALFAEVSAAYHLLVA